MSNAVLSDSGISMLAINYWKEKLQGATAVHLPVDNPGQPGKTAARGYVTFSAEADLGTRLKRLSKEQTAGLFTILFSVFNVLLYRYSSQEDIVVGNLIPDFDNYNAGFPAIMLRNSINGNQIFTEFLQKAGLTIADAFKYHNIGGTDQSLANLLFVFISKEKPMSGASDSMSKLTGRSDLTLIAEETETGILFRLDFNKNLFNKDTIQRIAAHYQQLLNSVAEDPDKPLGALPMLTKAEENDILVKFNDTLTPYSFQKTITDLFEEQVERSPDAVALRQHGMTMTYKELNEHANRLAHYLIANGVQKGDNVGLITTRDFDMIVGMYGIMKAGGAYVPIDPEYPIERQQYILGNSAVIKVIADGDYPLQNLIPAERFIKLNSVDLSSFDTKNPGLKVDSKQLAYTIYTSGSTGRPKGVMIEHHSAVNLIEWVNKEYKLGADDRLLFITSMCFDLSVYDIFGLLAAGGSIVIVEQSELMDVPKLKDMMQRYEITFWDSVPSTMDYLVRELESQGGEYLQNSLRVVFMSGDWIPVNLPDRIKKYFPLAKVISLGGATEGTIWSNYYPIEKVGKNWSSIPYGRPLANNFFYILNEQLQPVPIGVAGELYIGGVGVARGYANDPDKTGYSYVADPFNQQAGGRMYRTGDLGRMLPDMNMEFIGRKDDQVKIRGYRIELGEIESVLKQSDLIRGAVVLAKADKEGKKRLISYVVGKPGYDREKVIASLKSKLPDYMIPALWMEMDSLPLTSNGKIDKKALPDFDAEEQQKNNFVAPRTPSEKLLADIWMQVLKLKTVGVNDNFFDIGGHSLLAVQIMTRIGKKTGKKHPIAILFRYPTIAALDVFMRQEDTVHNSKLLVPIKEAGTKVPLYIVHGAGLNVLNFNDLVSNMDAEQPVFGLQGIGLNGENIQLDSIEHIAASYVAEIVKHDPDGPYAIAGYSIGGFIAVEMVRQLKEMGKPIKMLGIFDTDAENARDTEAWYIIMPKVIKRYLPRFMGGTKSLSKQLAYLFKDKTGAVADKVGVGKKPDSKEYYVVLDKMIDKYFAALEHYKLMPIDATVHLFKAEINDHYNDDAEFLGWRKYALKGVKINHVPGNHLNMLTSPNVAKFGAVLQQVLDNL